MRRLAILANKKPKVKAEDLILKWKIVRGDKVSTPLSLLRLRNLVKEMTIVIAGAIAVHFDVAILGLTLTFGH